MPRIWTSLLAAMVIAGNGATARAQANAAAPAPSAAKLDRISQYFENEVTTGKLAGAVVLIQQHGRPVYLKSFGVRDVATKLPMTPDTIFAIHSMTKPITSLAAMMLIDEGRLKLADPLSKYIPGYAGVKVGVAAGDRTPVLELVPPIRPVTIEDLMRHTSGISYDYIGSDLIMMAYRDGNIFKGNFTNKDLAERIARLPLARQPGTLWRYGFSTDVLGRVIEIVSGKTLYQFLKERILDPLGMTSTKFVLQGAAEQARMAEPLPNDAVLRAAGKNGENTRHGNQAAAVWSRPSMITRDFRRCCSTAENSAASSISARPRSN